MKTIPLFVAVHAPSGRPPAGTPNIVLIYADDLGYGDLSLRGTRVATPARPPGRAGLRFTDAHSSAATCTPSRYALLTGEYAWRKKGTGILPGDARLIIEPGPHDAAVDAARRPATRPAWSASGTWPGRRRTSTGTARSSPARSRSASTTRFIIPATGDRVPCVYVENHRVVGLDPNDPIQVSYERAGRRRADRQGPSRTAQDAARATATTRRSSTASAASAT